MKSSFFTPEKFLAKLENGNNLMSLFTFYKKK